MPQNRMALLLLAAAVISLVEIIVYWPDQLVLSISAGIVFIIFLIIGSFARSLGRPAFLVGIWIYVLHTAVLLFLAIAINNGLVLLFKDIVVHAIVLYRLWVGYKHFENEHALAN
jgi:hypothetical protein